MFNILQKYRSIFILLVFILVFSFFSPSQAAPSLASRLKGYILLQVEQNGEAWYVIPTEQKKVYMKDGQVAYQMMRELSLGISNANLAKIPVGIESRFNDTDTDQDGLSDKLEEGLETNPLLADTDNDGFSDGEEIKNNYNPLNKNKLVYDNSLVNRLKGYILLQAEKQGQAWYLNPKDGKRYYMKDGEAAYQIMRYLSLGITNNNLNLIPNSSRTFNIPGSNNGNQNNNNNNNNNNSTSTPPGNNGNQGGNSGGGGGGGGGGNSNPPLVDNDLDNDGYNSVASGGNDCDDANASIHPGAVEICGDSIDQDCSGADLACVIIDTQSPTIPSNLTAQVTGTQVSLSWTASSDNVGVSGYNILRSQTNGSGYMVIATSTTNSYVNTGLANGTYYYVVRAYDAAFNYSGNSAQVVAVISVVSDTTAPTVPTNLSATPSGSQVSLTWTASTDTNGVAGYNILRSQTNGSGYMVIATSTTNSYVNTGLANGTYYYVVRAYDAAFNYSGNSSQVSATISGQSVSGPVINSLSDTTLSDGQSVTISGSGFGVKSPVAPLHWDNFEQGSFGQSIQTPAQGLPYAQANPAITTYGNNCYAGNLCSFTNSIPGVGGTGLAVMVSPRNPSTTPKTTLFSSAKIKLRSSDDSLGYIGAKYFRFNTNDDNSFVHGSPNFDFDLSRALATNPPTPRYNVDGKPLHGSYGMWYFGGFDPLPHNQWIDLSIWSRIGGVDQANGYVGRSYNGEVLNAYGVTIDGSCTETGYRNVAVVPYIDRYTAPGRTVEISIDDFYIDDTFSRIVIAQNPNWSSHGADAMQIPHTIWQDGTISFTVNRSAFAPGSTAYLFVVNADDIANAIGYPITFN